MNLRAPNRRPARSRRAESAMTLPEATVVILVVAVTLLSLVLLLNRPHRKSAANVSLGAPRNSRTNKLDN